MASQSIIKQESLDDNVTFSILISYSYEERPEATRQRSASSSSTVSHVQQLCYNIRKWLRAIGKKFFKHN